MSFTTPAHACPWAADFMVGSSNGMTTDVTASPSRSAGAIPTLIKILLIPSWVVGFGAVLIVIDPTLPLVPQSIASPHTLVILIFVIVPAATLMATGLAIVDSLRNRRR